MSLALGIFVFSLAMTLYLYFGYPLLLLALSRSRQRPIDAADIRPAVTLVIPAFNEAEVIGDKIDNSLALDYPADRLEILVASDGSTDATDGIVDGYDDPRVRLLRLPRRGKAAALNAAAAAARHDILVFTDANATLAPDSLRKLVRPYADPEVGGVCGNKLFRSPDAADTTEEGEGLYWRYDKWQKRLETRLGSIFAADGALHSVRRRLYVPIEDPAQADDIAISTRVVLQGHRLVYEPEARVFEEAPRHGTVELRRKIRVTNHSFRALLNLRSALLTSGFYSLELLSHKLLRHLSPFFLLPLLVSNALLLGAGSLFRLTLALQIAFWGLAALGFLLRGTAAGRLRLLTVPYYFGLVNLAAFLGVLSIVAGVRPRRWAPRGGLSTSGG